MIKKHLPTSFITSVALLLVVDLSTASASGGTLSQFAQEKTLERFGQVIRLLTGGVGVVVAIMAVLGGIQYITAAGNPQKISAAKGRIGQAIIAMFFFIFGVAILRWLVPGDIGINE